MKKLLSLCVVCLFIGMSAIMLSGSQSRDVSDQHPGPVCRSVAAGLARRGRRRREKFARLTVPECLFIRTTATCRSR